MTAHKHTSKTIAPQLEHNFGLRSSLDSRVWGHIQCKTNEELETLTKAIGKDALRGRRQHLPRRMEGCYSQLSLSDVVNCSLADADVNAAFAHINLRHCSAELMLCEKAELNIWVRFKSEAAQNKQSTVTNFLNATRHNAEVSQLKPEGMHENEITSKPRHKF